MESYTQGKKFSSATSLYLLCCILRILKIKDLANTVAVALICSIEGLSPNSEAKLNGFREDHEETHDSHVDDEKPSGNSDSSSIIVSVPSLSVSPSIQHNCSASVLRYETSLNDSGCFISFSFSAQPLNPLVALSARDYSLMAIYLNDTCHALKVMFIYI